MGEDILTGYVSQSSGSPLSFVSFASYVNDQLAALPPRRSQNHRERALCKRLRLAVRDPQDVQARILKEMEDRERRKALDGFTSLSTFAVNASSFAVNASSTIFPDLFGSKKRSGSPDPPTPPRRIQNDPQSIQGRIAKEMQDRDREIQRCKAIDGFKSLSTFASNASSTIFPDLFGSKKRSGSPDPPTPPRRIQNDPQSIQGRIAKEMQDRDREIQRCKAIDGFKSLSTFASNASATIFPELFGSKKRSRSPDPLTPPCRIQNDPLPSPGRIRQDPDVTVTPGDPRERSGNAKRQKRVFEHSSVITCPNNIRETVPSSP
ncbi:hypothetical protein DFJ77DRAFT_163927 [Powellomyces hirtus]|nr:hypothetical protein DFJ77DRAFT_163927 [Powellomyces hirtus]